LPFVFFAAYLVFRRRNPLIWAHWSNQSLWLVIVGLGLVISSLIATGLLADRQTGTYVPSHVENGRVVPGHFE
jgi:Family of unknown function (DUF6111)